MQSLTIIAEVADGIGMFGFAVAGLFASAGRRIDPVGVFVSVFTTAFGGGIIRDILLDLRPFYWLSHPQWIWMTLGLTILAPVIVRRVQRFGSVAFSSGPMPSGSPSLPSAAARRATGWATP